VCSTGVKLHTVIHWTGTVDGANKEAVFYGLVCRLNA